MKNARKGIKGIKEKVKAKASATKDKVKGKLKGKKCAALVALFMCAALCGCLETTPASRATTANYRIEVTVKVDDGARDNTFNLPFTIGDGALASADSAGSTETQTTTPTMDIKPDIDVRYNDAIASATAASKSVLGSIGDGLETVLRLMQSKETGTVPVVKTDGTAATVKCENGQCEFCTDCEPK